LEEKHELCWYEEQEMKLIEDNVNEENEKREDRKGEKIGEGDEKMGVEKFTEIGWDALIEGSMVEKDEIRMKGEKKKTEAGKLSRPSFKKRETIKAEQLLLNKQLLTKLQLDSSDKILCL
jgi:hypothetical protein